MLVPAGGDQSIQPRPDPDPNASFDFLADTLLDEAGRSRTG
jgi:hypothetical protein